MSLEQQIKNLCEQNVLVTVWKTKPGEYRCVIYPDLGYGDKIGVESDTVAGALFMAANRLGWVSKS